MSEHCISKKGEDKAFELSLPGFDSPEPFAERADKVARSRGDASGISPRYVKEEADVKIEGTWEGLPYTGKPYSFKNSDPDHMKPSLIKKAHVQVFLLSDEDDLKKYETVMQSICNGTSQLSVEEREYSKAEKTWRILLRWIDLSYTEPAHLKEPSYVSPKARKG